MTDVSESTTLHSDFKDGVLWLTLNRPASRNAINHDLRGRLHRAIQVDAVDPKVRVVVIQGDANAFCSGGDIKEMGGDPQVVARKLKEGSEIIKGIAGLAKPVIAGVRGHASGAGFSLAMACDIIVADESAVFSSIFIKRGLIPDLSGTFWLARQVGLFRAKEIIFSGRSLGASEAHDLGLVSKLCTKAKYPEVLNELVSEYAAGPTVAYGIGKSLLNRTFETDLSMALELEAAGQSRASATEDHENSIESFKSKVPPTYLGR